MVFLKGSTGISFSKIYSHSTFLFRVLGAMYLTSEQFAVKMPCLLKQRYDKKAQ
jgi:hypothetical protein